MDEATLLQNARRFSSSALIEIYDLYSPAIYKYALRQLGDPDSAEECVSETFTRFLHAIQRGGGPEQYVKAYLYRIAHNWITDQYRNPNFYNVEFTEETVDCVDNDSAEDEEKVHRQAWLRNAFRKLTPEQRQVISLKFLEGMSNDEVATVMNKPVGAVKALQSRGISSLQRLVKME